MNDLLRSSARTMARMIREGAISSAELMSAHIRRIEEVNPWLNAVVEPFFDSAMNSARAADERLARTGELGPLGGVPFSVKDSIDVAGYRTTAGTLGYRFAPPAQQDATLVARLRAAGAIPVAKTNLPDLLFAYESDNSIFGRTTNPYDPERTSGGSSGGESALIAACGSPLGLGSDAAGSVRLPAAFCGIASIKPTSGALPRTGHVPPAGGWVERLWQIGPMARHVEDLQLAFDLLAGPDGQDFAVLPGLSRAVQDLRQLRVAFITDNGFAPVRVDVAQVVENAAQALESAGATVEAVRPPGLEKSYDLELSLLGADGGAGLDSYVASLGSHPLHWLTEAGFLARVRPRALPTAEFVKLWAEWDQFRADLELFFHQFDAVLSPVYPEPALLHGQSVHEDKFRGFSYAMAWNVAGLPAATVRFGESEGLPLNVQVITGRGHDRQALALCRFLEEQGGGWQPPTLQERK